MEIMEISDRKLIKGYENGKTYQEIADELEVVYSTVYNRLQKLASQKKVVLRQKKKIIFVD
tara:strand:+ start:231 stop:413 length:183 start_codon:yes stop_codon:yes gene_type:complete